MAPYLRNSSLSTPVAVGTLTFALPCVWEGLGPENRGWPTSPQTALSMQCLGRKPSWASDISVGACFKGLLHCHLAIFSIPKLTLEADLGHNALSVSMSNCYSGWQGQADLDKAVTAEASRALAELDAAMEKRLAERPQ